MPRAIWKGAISFGLVNIPIEIHTAVRDNRPKFRLLHAQDTSPVHYERVCIREGQPVAWEDLVKGFEYEKGHFVVVTRDDFQAAALEKSQTIDILDFVKVHEIDGRYFETSYYLVPGRGGERAYALLREAMKGSGRVAVAKFILREDQHLAAIEVLEDALILTVMRFADEVVPLDTYEFPSAGQVRSQELDMARMLVENLAADWDPTKYTDEYRANLLKIIQAKIKGRKPELKAEVEPQQAEVIDLMERLRRSLSGTRGGGQPAAGKTKGKAAKARAARHLKTTVKVRKKGKKKAA